MSRWIKKDDRVVVIAGNEKGKMGTVLAHKDDRVVIQGLNIRKKHVKRQQKTASPEIVEKEMPIHISNVCLCDDSGKPIKVKVRTNAAGAKELFYKDGSKEILFRQVKKNP